MHPRGSNTEKKPSPTKSILKQPNQTSSKLVNIKIGDYEKKKFNPIERLTPDVSARLPQSYRDELVKQEEIHAEIKKILDPEKLKVYHDN